MQNANFIRSDFDEFNAIKCKRFVKFIENIMMMKKLKMKSIFQGLCQRRNIFDFRKKSFPVFGAYE